MDSFRSTFNHLAKHYFPNSEARHVTIISSILPYSSSCRDYLIKDIRSNIPNIHTNINVPDIDFTFHVHRSKHPIGSYNWHEPKRNNWTDMAFLAPTLHTDNLL